MKKSTLIQAILFVGVIMFSFPAFSQNENTSGKYPMPLIGDKAPSFSAKSTIGRINFPDDFFAKWKILFSHPGDFTPVCTSEVLEFALMYNDFKDLNCELIGLSVDGIASHIEWTKSMETITYDNKSDIKILFPLVSDITMEISKKYGMLHNNYTDVKTIRAVFVIDPDDIIQAILYYPASVGRNIDEIKRLVEALQTTARYNVATPVNWNKGDDVLVPVPESMEDREKFKSKQKNKNINCLEWYFCFKSL